MIALGMNDSFALPVLSRGTLHRFPGGSTLNTRVCSDGCTLLGSFLPVELDEGKLFCYSYFGAHVYNFVKF